MIIEKDVMFAVYNLTDEVLVYTLSFRAMDSKFEFTDFLNCTWKEAYKLGYRCRKVEVTIKTI